MDADGDFVGPRLVGKESLFVVETKTGDTVSFHKTFCIVQRLARKMALRFNRQLLVLPGVDESSTPTINFLECHVMVLHDETDSPDKGLLVEKMLDPKEYKKWNNNDGYVAFSLQKQDQQLGKSFDCSFSIEDIPQA